MAAGQPLRGLVGQGMNGRRKKPIFATGTGPAAMFPPGSFTFTVPTSGRWKFVGWSAGGGLSSGPKGYGAGSGAYTEITRFLTKGQTVAIVVGAGADGGAGGLTSITLPSGAVASCTGGTGAPAAGVASGGDLNLDGSASGAGQGTGGGASGGANQGAGAPGLLPFRGGAGGGGFASGISPGGGSGDLGAVDSQRGGDGLVIASFVPSFS